MKKLPIIAFHVGQRVDLQKVKSLFVINPIREESSFLLYRDPNQKYIYIKDYGSVVFIGYSKEEVNVLYRDVFKKLPNFEYQPSEDYKIIIDSSALNAVNFHDILVSSFSDDIAHIIVLNMGQSVALDYYQYRVNDLLEKTRLISKQLEENGRINMLPRKLNKFIGTTMVLKNRISENLFIFDTSDLAWSDEELSFLDNKLSKEFEFIERHQALQNSLNVVKENLDLFRGMLDHKHSSTLE